jgi:hypothetical protein
MNKLAPYWKAVVAFLVPGVIAVSYASRDGVLTRSEWITAACSCLITAASVYFVPNKDPNATHQDESVQPPQAGVGDVLYVLLVAAAVILVVLLFFALLGRV